MTTLKRKTLNNHKLEIINEKNDTQHRRTLKRNTNEKHDMIRQIRDR